MMMSLMCYKESWYRFYVNEKMEKRKMIFKPKFKQIRDLYIQNKKKFNFAILKGHKRPITCCKFVPLKKMIISGAKDGSLIYCKFLV